MDAVTDALREVILDGLIPASSWLRETELAVEMSVSRTPIRDAIRRLVSEGLVTRVPNQGARVAPMGMEDILAIYAVRENLEGLAARIAAQHVNEMVLRRMAASHVALRRAAEAGDVAGFAQGNLEFHRAMREATGNPYLERFLTLVEHAVRRFGSTTFENRDRIDATLVEHEAILGAISEGRSEDAEFLARSHMRRAHDARIAAFIRANT